MALPLATVAALSLSPRESVWPHLIRTVLPGALADTGLLLAGVAALTLLFGTGTAWLVTMYRFPGRGLLDRALVLPLAMPTYIIAYCYVELLDFSGPVQRALRALFGWHTVKDYWFPEVRTLTGAILVLSAVLYPYVYLSARASFVQQSVCVLEVARTLGRTSAGAFWSVALPLARPALAAGVALALMESLNDLGAVQYLGVSTLTVSIYTTWLQRSSLTGAAQIALVALLFVVALLVAERPRGVSSQFHHTTGRYRSIPFSDLEGWRGSAAASRVLPARDRRFRRAVRRAPPCRPLPTWVTRWRPASGGRSATASAWRHWRRSPRSRSASASPTRGGSRPPSRALGGAVGGPRLRHAGHGARARADHPAGGARQPRRRRVALAVRRLQRPAAVGEPVRDRPRLHHPLPRRVAGRAGGGLRASVAQPRRGGSHAGRDGAVGAAARAHAAAGAAGRISAAPGCRTPRAGRRRRPGRCPSSSTARR